MAPVGARGSRCHGKPGGTIGHCVCSSPRPTGQKSNRTEEQVAPWQGERGSVESTDARCREMRTVITGRVCMMLCDQDAFTALSPHFLCEWPTLPDGERAWAPRAQGRGGRCRLSRHVDLGWGVGAATLVCPWKGDGASSCTRFSTCASVLQGGVRHLWVRHQFTCRSLSLQAVTAAGLLGTRLSGGGSPWSVTRFPETSWEDEEQVPSVGILRVPGWDKRLLSTHPTRRPV